MENADNWSAAKFYRTELERTNRYWADEAEHFEDRLKHEVSVCAERVAEVQLHILGEAGQ